MLLMYYICIHQIKIIGREDNNLFQLASFSVVFQSCFIPMAGFAEWLDRTDGMGQSSSMSNQA